MRMIGPALLLLLAASTASAQESLAPAPTRLTDKRGIDSLGAVLAAIETSAGLRVTAEHSLDRRLPAHDWQQVPFWIALEELAQAADLRIRLSERGTKIELVPGKSGPSQVVGSFRLVARELTIRHDFESDEPIYDLALLLHWEPRFPVIRIEPGTTEAVALTDGGKRVRVGLPVGKVPVSGSALGFNVRLPGLNRSDRRLTSIEVPLRVTLADTMLRPRFADLTAALPVRIEEKGVGISLTRVSKSGPTWLFELELAYPPNQPVFESFESWLSDARATLIDPSGKLRFEPTSLIVAQSSPIVKLAIRFRENVPTGLVLGDRRGWSLVVEIPSPLREVAIPFRLHGIDLP